MASARGGPERLRAGWLGLFSGASCLARHSGNADEMAELMGNGPAGAGGGGSKGLALRLRHFPSSPGENQGSTAVADRSSSTPRRPRPLRKQDSCWTRTRKTHVNFDVPLSQVPRPPSCPCRAPAQPSFPGLPLPPLSTHPPSSVASASSWGHSGSGRAPASKAAPPPAR